MLNSIKEAVKKLDELSKQKKICVISHYDTDGITSAAIISRALSRWNKQFSIKIIKGIEEEIINALPEKEILLFLDLASNSLDYLAKKNTEIFILDHHEITQEIPQNVTIINPLIFKEEPISGAGLSYLFAKTISQENRDLATLAVIGMIGDTLETDIGKLNSEIIKDSETIIRKGLLIYPSTRPLDRTLEYSSSPYIPGVTGSFKGTLELLKDANITTKNGYYKSLTELTDEEMGSLITAVMLRCANTKQQTNLIGNLYLVKFFNKMEDAREISALINACSRMDCPNISLGFCLGNKKFKEEAEKIYIKYKQHLISALKYVEELEKITGKDYAIINTKDYVKDTIIGTVTSIISRSPVYSEGTIIVALAYNKDKIKVSARIAGRHGRNVREVLSKVVVPLGGEVGGHPNAAGCLISKELEGKFIEELKKTLEIEVVKV
ncbi:MAG: DHH family phosphoesterase [archaeon]|nr:DHH family phosphoesterase [archaeon]